MTNTCILTDEIAQFLDVSFPGQERVHLMPMGVTFTGLDGIDRDKLKAFHLPNSRYGRSTVTLNQPQLEDFRQAFTNLSRKYDEIVAVLSASWLTHSVRTARIAAASATGGAKIEIIDSDSLGVGMGYLVTLAARLAAQNASATTIKRYLLGMVSKVYSILCIRNFSYLESLGLIESSQAIVGEMLNVSQVYYVNQGELIPVQKVRNARHLIECFQEFVGEFEHPGHIALLQSGMGFQQEVRTLRERFTSDYPIAKLSEQNLSLPIAALLGPLAFGLFLWETDPEEALDQEL